MENQNIDDIANETMPQEDIELFNSMKGHYVSENERIFFDNMQRKEEDEWTTQGDLILSEKDNDLKLFLMRVCYNEYQFGRPISGDSDGTPTQKAYMQCPCQRCCTRTCAKYMRQTKTLPFGSGCVRKIIKI